MADNDDADAHGAPMNPFDGLPMFGDLSRMLAGQGPLNWDAARQFALLSASGDTEFVQGRPVVSGNVDPAVRIAFGQLVDIARMQVADVMGLDVPLVEPAVVTPEVWATEALEAYRPLFTEMATSLGQADTPPDAVDTSDPFAQMMSGISRMLAPAMLGMSVGSLVGGLARRAFGVYDLPIPRVKPSLAFVPATIDGFAQDWSIPVDEMRMWVAAHELAGLTLFSVEHLATHLRTLVQRHVAAFRPDPSAIADKLGSLDVGGGDPMAAIQNVFADPEILLGAVRSPEQLAMEPDIDTAVATAIGTIDWVVDAVAVRLVGGEALRIAEAVRRRRAESSDEDIFVERLLGIRLGNEQTARGKAFVQGVVDRAGEHGLAPLFNDPEAVPTPNEIEAPGLWLARVTGA